MTKGTKKTKTRKKRTPVKKSLRFTKADVLPLVSVLILTAILFFRATGFEFVNWDDDFNISKNPNLRHFDWANIRGIFTSHVIGNYNPLPILTFAIEKHFFGLDPHVYHTTNVLLHLVCTGLVYRFLRLLDMPIWAAAISAAIFGIHPMRIESVAWVTERKDVLFVAFYIGSMIQYVKYRKSKAKTKYLVFSLLLFAFSLLSKIQAVALPLSLIAIDYLLNRKLTFKLVWSKWYYFLLSLATGLVGIYFLRQQGSLDTTEVYNFGQRVLIGIYSYIVYIGKFLVPFRISPLYPYPASLPWFIYVSPVLLAGLGYLGYYGFKRKWKPLVFGLAFYTVNIMFVLQVVGAGQGFLADRFTYLPYLGLIYPLVYYAWNLASKNGRLRIPVAIAGAAWGIALCVLTWIHVPIWQNSGSLWSHVLKYYTKTALPFRNRAQYYRDNGQLQLALQDYNRSIQLKQDPDVINSRARLYFDNQMWDEAMTDYTLAINLSPDIPKASEYYINRGAVYAMQGKWQEALADMTKGIELEPDFANGYKNRSLVYQRVGQKRKAKADLEMYLELNPYDPDIWYELGRITRGLAEAQEAIIALSRAISLDNQKGFYYLERARAYYDAKDMQKAREDFLRAEALGAEIDELTRNAIMQ